MPMDRLKSFLTLILVLSAVLSFALMLSCGDDDDDDDDSVADDDDSVDDDDDNDDDSIDDDDDDDDDNDDNDDDTVFADDYVAPWPQPTIETPDYDEQPAAGPMRLKAEDYDQFNVDWHQPYYGSNIGKVKFTDATHTVVQKYDWWGDSTAWTAVYMGSQAMRYYVTGDPVAKANATRSLDALDRNRLITGRPGFLSRIAAPQTSLIYEGDAWCDNRDACHHPETGPYAGDFWEGETSRDMYVCWFNGMATAYDLIDDPAARDLIEENITAVLDDLMANHWFIIDVTGLPSRTAPNFFAVQKLAYSLVGYHITGEDRYKAEAQKWIVDSRRDLLRLVNVSFNLRYGAYFPIHLNHQTMYPLLRLAKAYLGPDDHAFLLELFETQTHTFARLSHNPYFNTIFMSQGEYDPAEPEYQAQLEEDLTDFRDAPMTEYYVDPADTALDPTSVFLHDLIAQYPFFEYIFGEIEYQSLEAHPVLEQCTTDILWQRNPFRIEPCGSDRPEVTHSGVDYLMAYWMASYYKFIDKSF
jgi:hypothetical protein